MTNATADTIQAMRETIDLLSEALMDIHMLAKENPTDRISVAAREISSRAVKQALDIMENKLG